MLEVLEALHDDPKAGHLGFSRTLERVQEYYWPCLTADITHYLTTCRYIQIHKTPPTRPARFLQPIEPPRRPFQRIGINLPGLFLTSTSGNKWIIVATDYLTCYTKRGPCQKVVPLSIENMSCVTEPQRSSSPTGARPYG